MISNELAEAMWAPRPPTPAGRVKASLRGPEKGVDPSWWKRHHGAREGDVEKLSDEDVLHALAFAGRRWSKSIEAGRDELHKMIFGKGRSKPKPAPKPDTRKWSQLSKAEQEEQVDEALMSFAEVGKRLTRTQARARARAWWDRNR